MLWHLPPKQALYWFGEAAARDDVQSQYNLGLMYANGEASPQDYAMAYAMFSLAAAKGHKDGKENRDNILKKMSPGQIEKGQKLSTEFSSNLKKSSN